MSCGGALTETDAGLLASSERAFAVAPAGFGKTELIAHAVELGAQKSLVLTHTHSGVNAMRARLQRLGVPREKFEVATIAGWALKYASAYPSLSGLSIALPSGNEWPQVYEAAVEILRRKVTQNVIRRSFSGVYVDEYQDCNLVQHSIVMAIADILPCRLLGDPLQAIFDFDEPTIDWRNDVVSNFERLPDLATPFRWLDTNPGLGNWFSEVRLRLIAGQSIDLGNAPLEWMDNTPQNRMRACFQAARNRDSSVAAIMKWPSECHLLASSLNGLYGSMETLDCQGLMSFARQIDEARNGTEKVMHMIAFATQCFTAVGTHLSAFTDLYQSGSLPSTTRLGRNRLAVEALNRLASDPTPDSLIEAARAIERYPDARLYRRELWQEMKTAVLTFRSARHASLQETAWYVRDRARHNGRRPDLHVVSRTLLVKGLEFDHSVVVENGFNAKEFYVALTRGKHRLTVLSSNPVVAFEGVSNTLQAYPSS